MASLIAYLRVSTQRQGISGLGLEAQKAAVDAFMRAHHGHVVETFVEVESGKNCARPQLAAALAKCKAMGATLVVAKLDRLARDVVFIATLMRDGVDFVACDMPFANKLTVHILSAVAQAEGEAISHRTKVALQAAKARGVKLGGFRGRHLTNGERNKGRAVQRARAHERASLLLPIISEIKASGSTTLAAIASALNERGVLATRGGKWAPTQVMHVLRAVPAR